MTGWLFCVALEIFSEVMTWLRESNSLGIITFEGICGSAICIDSICIGVNFIVTYTSASIACVRCPCVSYASAIECLEMHLQSF